MDAQSFAAEGQCVRVERCTFQVSDMDWAFAKEHAENIAANWQRHRARTPSMFDGTVYLLREHAVHGAALTGTFFKTDFKTFLYWSDGRQDGTGVGEGFGTSVIRSAEGHILLGRQAPGHLNSGRIYPPSGLIDGEDVRGDTIDIEASIVRELGEETGLGPGLLARAPGYILSRVGPLLAIAAEWHSPLPAEDLRETILHFVRSQSNPELADIVIVRRCADIDERATPAYARALLGTLLPA